jgi:hypothetical protein
MIERGHYEELVKHFKLVQKESQRIQKDVAKSAQKFLNLN